MTEVHNTPLCRSLEPDAGEASNYSVAIRISRSGGDESGMVRAMEAASQSGDPRAHYALATWYLHGSYGYPHEPQAAVPLLLEAAEGSVREAMFDLAVALDTGNGVDEDPRRAYLWYLRAAVRGEAEAVGMVANYTSTGRGTPPDDEVALIWYELAEALGVDVEDAQAFRRFMRGDTEE